VLGEKRWNMFDPDILAWRLQLGVERPFLASLFEIRQALEPLAAAAAAIYRTEADLAAMTQAWTDMGRQPATRDSFTAADLAFHRAILEASANPFLRSIGSVIEAALATSFMISSPVDEPKWLADTSRQHRHVLDAIASGNAQGASDAMAAVILQGASHARIDKLKAPCVEIAIKLLGVAAVVGEPGTGGPSSRNTATHATGSTVSSSIQSSTRKRTPTHSARAVLKT
jgi:DNA-binding FadR family transcriptional regulator